MNINMNMSFLCWNCRGAAAKSFIGRVKDVLAGKNVSIFVLLETRVSGVKADRIIRKLGFNTWIRLEATGYAGGIWILWNKEETSIRYISSTTQFIHVQVAMPHSPQYFWMSCVYAEPNHQLRVPLWEDLINISSSISGPWQVLGDFNSYLTCDDKKGGSNPNLRSMNLFWNCIQQCSLLDMEYVGDRFTWEKNMLKERIDWVFSNTDWNDAFPFAKVHHLSNFNSMTQTIFPRSNRIS